MMAPASMTRDMAFAIESIADEDALSASDMEFAIVYTQACSCSILWACWWSDWACCIVGSCARGIWNLVCSGNLVWVRVHNAVCPEQQKTKNKQLH